MKTSELRLGNITSEGVICGIIGSTCWIEGKTAPTLLDEISGVPLTEEWLNILGFSYNYFEGYHHYLDMVEYNYSFTYSIISKSFSTNIKVGYELEFVHQIQNLFYSITGEELTLKT